MTHDCLKQIRERNVNNTNSSMHRAAHKLTHAMDQGIPSPPPAHPLSIHVSSPSPPSVDSSAFVSPVHHPRILPRIPHGPTRPRYGVWLNTFCQETPSRTPRSRSREYESITPMKILKINMNSPIQRISLPHDTQWVEKRARIHTDGIINTMADACVEMWPLCYLKYVKGNGPKKSQSHQGYSSKLASI